MKRNLEEQKISQWFREARHADESRAPAFAEMLRAAQAKNQRGGRWLVWRIAFATVSLLVISIATLIFFKQSPNQPLDPVAGGAVTTPLPNDPPELRSPVALDAPITPPAEARKWRRAHSKSSHRGPRVAQPRSDAGQATLLSFKWQSPTDFLLRTPGADVLKTVPRLGDSLVRFDTLTSDEKN
jgi:hypothetical protein